MRWIAGKIEKWLNSFKLKTKLQGLYIFCVILPLVLTDGIILYNVLKVEETQKNHEMENLASAVQYNIFSVIQPAATIADTIYTDEEIETFLNRYYRTPLDYVTEYQKFMKTSILGKNVGNVSTRITVYADNKSILNGGEFGRITKIKGTTWYHKLMNDERNAMLLFYYDDWQSPAVDAKRKLLFLQKLNLVTNRGCQKVAKIEIEYNSLVKSIKSMNYESPFFVCQNGKILFSNIGNNNIGQPFEVFDLYDQVGYKKDVVIYGENLEIYVLKEEMNLVALLKENIPLICFLLFINILLPYILMSNIEKSLTFRITQLREAFDSVEKDNLKRISDIHGNDEIAMLMKNYNRMADRTNELIKTVYKDKLREQQMSIAKQNAELLALHSQINPHFLFNALESIRMHSILRQEFETADMVKKLATMQRQNVNWGSDQIEIKQEVEFVEAYLGLQKYRFGERLSYQLEIEKECEKLKIPKLTVVTFVENACVHGIESKTVPGWIFVRIYKDQKYLYIEVEDTGSGMTSDKIEDIKDKMNNTNIDRLKEKKSVGILNACLRLKMLSENKAQFEVDSELGVGTTIQIQVPLEKWMKE